MSKSFHKIGDLAYCKRDSWTYASMKGLVCLQDYPDSLRQSKTTGGPWHLLCPLEACLRGLCHGCSRPLCCDGHLYGWVFAFSDVKVEVLWTSFYLITIDRKTSCNSALFPLFIVEDSKAKEVKLLLWGYSARQWWMTTLQWVWLAMCQSPSSALWASSWRGYLVVALGRRVLPAWGKSPRKPENWNKSREKVGWEKPFFVAHSLLELTN